MNEQEAIEQLSNEYLVSMTGKETPARVRYHNEALDVAIAALKEVQEYHAIGYTPKMVRGLISGYNKMEQKCRNYKMVEMIRCQGETNTRWIPVSERLPEKEDEINYLVTIRGYGVDIANYIKSAKVWVSLGVPCEVIAWKPLPEPYHITDPGKKEEVNGEK